MPTTYDFNELSLPGLKLINMKSRSVQFILTFIFICLIPFIFKIAAYYKLPVF